MPNKAIVGGILTDATLSPIAGGKIVATLNGSDMFDEGVRVVTQKIEATTNAQGAWSLALIVNAEGAGSATSWTIEGFDAYVAKVFEAKSLFVASALPISLGDLEKTSAQNLKAAQEGGSARILVVADHALYQSLPAAQRHNSDIVLVKAA
jgi:hypothetical protein